MIFQEKCFLCYILLTDQISQFDSGAQPEIFQGKGGLVGLGHFYKHFVKKHKEKRPRSDKLGSFFS